MSLPVSRASYIYSHFRHVSGVPAPEGGRGVSITRLKVLDTLIEQLAQIKKQPKIDAGALSPTDDRIDALISQYQGQIKAAQAAREAMPYVPAPTAQAGALFALSA
jgi:hypothetical protein